MDNLAQDLKARQEQHMRLEAIKLAVQVKNSTTDTREVIRSAHGIADFILTGNKKADTL